MKIFIDDYRDKPPEYDIKVDRLSRFLGLLLTQDVKLISFDHDLDGYALDGNAFAQVAVWLYREGSIEKFEWRVHSANPVGADRIRHTLRGMA